MHIAKRLGRFLTCFEHEFGLFASLLTYSGIKLHRADTIEQADFLLVVTPARVLICDPEFIDGTWEAAARMLATFHPAVSLVVVESEEGAPRIATKSAIVLPRPLRFREMQKAIIAANIRANP